MSVPDAFTATRRAYDAAALTYAELFRYSLRDSPMERAILAAFAEMVRTNGNGEIADLGCGPGHVTAHLAELAVNAFGVDASPAMIALTRQAYPELWFEVASMAETAIPDGTLGGVLSRWSVIHLPPQELPAVLTEFSRVLTSRGHLLIGFSASDGPSCPTQVFDHAVAPAYRWWPDSLAALLHEAGWRRWPGWSPSPCPPTAVGSRVSTCWPASPEHWSLVALRHPAVGWVRACRPGAGASAAAYGHHRPPSAPLRSHVVTGSAQKQPRRRRPSTADAAAVWRRCPARDVQ